MPTPVLLKGSPLAGVFHEGIRAETAMLLKSGIAPGLALVIVGDDRSSALYFSSVEKTASKDGIRTYPHKLSQDATLNEVLNLIKTLNADDRINGILVFQPLPRRLDQRTVLNSISPEKDIDGLGAISIGRLAAEESTYQIFLDHHDFSLKNTFLPCTPYGVIKLLEHYKVPLHGKDVTIIGKSLTVGKSLALMMLAEGATVTVCHKDTLDLGAKTRTAGIICVAAGRPGLVTADMVKEGVAVVDIGITYLPDGSFVGDVDFKGVSAKASHITPVPGGVGPVTISILLKNTVISAKRMFHID